MDFFNEFCYFLQICSALYLPNCMQQGRFCVGWLPERKTDYFFNSLNSSKEFKLPFSDFATFVTRVVLE
jgi:hypothetical protein